MGAYSRASGAFRIGSEGPRARYGITCLGDSQTHGSGWVDTLATSIGQTIHNEGQSSAKVGWALGLDTQDPDTTPNTTFAPIDTWSGRRSKLYIVWFGLNDSFENYLGAGTAESVRESTFYSRLGQVCKICNDAMGAQVALLSTQQYGASYTDYVSRNDKTDRYDAYKAQLASERAYVHHITETGFTMASDEHISATDLHFTAAGHATMAAAVESGLSAAGLI